MSGINRRNFVSKSILGGLVVNSSPVQTLVELMVGKASVANAQTAPSEKKFVSIQQAGAPARWMFDLLLNPYDDNNFIVNPQMGTVFKAENNRYVETMYQLNTIKGLKLPPIWNFSLPKNGTSTQKMADALLNHVIHIRGIDIGVPAHLFAQQLSFTPPGAVRSTTALAAEISSAPFAAIDIGTRGYIFKSIYPLVSTSLVGGGQLLTELMQPFMNPTTVNNDANLKAALNNLSMEVEKAQHALDMEFVAGQPGFEGLLRSRNDLWKILRSRFPDPATEWNRLFDKYETLVKRAINSVYPGINDKVVGAPIADRTSDRFKNSHCLESNLVNSAGLDNLNSLITANSSVNGLANIFAVAEYALVNHLTSSISGGHAGINNLNFTPFKFQNFDEHTTGSVISLLMNTLSHAALGSCLMEFISVLKEKNMFKDTVIDVHSEFNRAPRKDLVGSDHGYHGGSTMILTGMQESGPMIIGDIMRDFARGNANDQYKGSWGNSAPMDALAGASLIPANKAATIAALLGVPSPTKTAYSVVSNNGGILDFAPGFSKGKIVG
ncbi:MAG: DUF1501 domain-containing protein [Proteobacteria bacterium]|nr:DUF1501 domain-containing protein [Pseudomonadota bacterium]